MGNPSILQVGGARPLRSRRFGAFQVNVLVGFKGDVRHSGRNMFWSVSKATLSPLGVSRGEPVRPSDRALQSKHFGAFQVHVLVGLKGDVRLSGVEPWGTHPSFRWVGLGPCEADVLEPSRCMFSRFQRQRYIGPSKPTFWSLPGECFNRFQRRR